MKRTKEDAALTRQSVLDSASSVIARKGYAQTTLEEVARAAGVTRGAIYWHFKNKFEIFQAVLRERYDSAKIRMDKIIYAKSDPITRIRGLIREMFLMISDKEHFGIIEEIELFKHEKKEELRTIYIDHLNRVQEMKNIIVELLEQGIAAKQFDPSLDRRVTVIAMLSYIAGIKSSWLAGLVDISIEDNAEKLADIFIHGIGYNGGSLK